MKILHLLYESRGDHFGIGGVGIRAYEIYRHLSTRHDITLLCRKYPGAREGMREGLRHLFAGVESQSLTRTLLAYARQASRFVRAEGHRFDVIIEEFSPAVPTLLFRYRKRPLVLQVQGYTGTQYFRKYPPHMALPLYCFERFFPGRYRHFIFVSAESRQRFALGRDANVGIISNGVTDDLLRGVPSESDFVLFLGRLDVHHKGIDTLLAAFQDVHAAAPSLRLTIAGDGRDRDAVHRSVAALPLSVREHIDLPGWVDGDKKASLLRNALFVVVPSRYETQGIVVLEAAASAKAVIVSQLPELRVVEEVGAGLSFPCEDAALLASRMKDLLADEELRRACGVRGRAWAASHTWDRIALQYEAFLLDVCRRSAGR